MLSNFLIVRQLKVTHPDLYNEIVNDISKNHNINDVLSKFCAFKGCTRAQVAENADGLRTTFVAVLLKMFDPYVIETNTRVQHFTLKDAAKAIGCSHAVVRQVACNVKGLLRAHKPFIREVDRIIEGIKDDSEERE